MKLIFTITLTLFFMLGHAQTDSLKVSCEAYYQVKAQAEVEEFKQLRKYKFLRFLPSFGYSLQRADFIVALNTNGIISYLENKQIRNNKVSSIIQTNKLLLQQDLRTLQLLKNEINQVKKQKEIILKSLEIDRKIFKIKEQQYQKAELESLLFLLLYKY